MNGQMKPHWALQDIAEQENPSGRVNLWPGIAARAGRPRWMKWAGKGYPAYQGLEGPLRKRRKGLHRLAFGLAALVLALGLVLVVSPGAQAMARQFLRQIGVLTFEEVEQITVQPEQGLELVTISPEEAKAAAPFTVRLPAWMPEPFPLEPKFEAAAPPGSETAVPGPGVLARWDSRRGTIHLSMMLYNGDIKEHYETRGEKVGPGSVEEVTVQGEPAALLKGVWVGSGTSLSGDSQPATLTWGDLSDGGSLLWVRDGIFYILFWSSPPDVESPLAAEEILRIANSIP